MRVVCIKDDWHIYQGSAFESIPIKGEQYNVVDIFLWTCDCGCDSSTDCYILEEFPDAGWAVSMFRIVDDPTKEFESILKNTPMAVREEAPLRIAEAYRHF